MRQTVNKVETEAATESPVPVTTYYPVSTDVTVSSIGGVRVFSQPDAILTPTESYPAQPNSIVTEIKPKTHLFIKEGDIIEQKVPQIEENVSQIKTTQISNLPEKEHMDRKPTPASRHTTKSSVDISKNNEIIQRQRQRGRGRTRVTPTLSDQDNETSRSQSVPSSRRTVRPGVGFVSSRSRPVDTQRKKPIHLRSRQRVVGGGGGGNSITQTPPKPYKTSVYGLEQVPSLYIETDLETVESRSYVDDAIDHAQVTWAQDPFRQETLLADLDGPVFDIDFSKDPGREEEEIIEDTPREIKLSPGRGIIRPQSVPFDKSLFHKENLFDSREEATNAIDDFYKGSTNSLPFEPLSVTGFPERLELEPVVISIPNFKSPTRLPERQERVILSSATIDSPSITSQSVAPNTPVSVTSNSHRPRVNILSRGPVHISSSDTEPEIPIQLFDPFKYARNL